VSHLNPDLLLELKHTRRKFRPHRKVIGGLIDPVAVLDVFLIFVAFLVSYQYSGVRPGINLELPESNSLSSVPLRSSLVLTVSKEGLLFFNDERVTLQGLDLAFRQAAYSNPSDALVLYADETLTAHDIQGLVSLARDAGIREVVWIGKEPDSARSDQNPRAKIGVTPDSNRSKFDSTPAAPNAP